MITVKTVNSIPIQLDPATGEFSARTEQFTLLSHDLIELCKELSDMEKPKAPTWVPVVCVSCSQTGTATVRKMYIALLDGHIYLNLAPEGEEAKSIFRETREMKLPYNYTDAWGNPVYLLSESRYYEVIKLSEPLTKAKLKYEKACKTFLSGVEDMYDDDEVLNVEE